MAGEIAIHLATGLANIKAEIIFPDANYGWTGTQAVLRSAVAPADLQAGLVSLTESEYNTGDKAGLYVGDFPAGITTPGTFGVRVWQTETWPPSGDPLGVMTIDWNGSREAAFPPNLEKLGINASGHVSRVTLVDTCTQNSDMRGTDGAATPADLGDLQSHGDSNWATATGFATRDDLQALQAHGDEAWASTDTSGLATSDDLVQVATAVEAMQQALASGVFLAGESILAIREGLSTFNPSQHGVMLASQQPAYAPAKAGDPMALTAEERGAVATALLQLANGIENGFSLQDALRFVAAAVAGLVSGAGSGVERFKGLDQTTDRLTVFVDEAGNRTGITYHR